MKKLLLVFVFSLFVSSTVFAQQATATLTGVVSDQTGAVIAGATVTAKNNATNFSRMVMTNGDGVYVVTNLPPGTYQVKTESKGFNTQIMPATLNVGQTLTFNVSLTVGKAFADPIYIYDGNRIDVETSKVDSVIATKEIDSLPLNGRNFLELALLTPGNSPAPNFDPTKTNTVLISSAGQLGRGGNVSIDGTDNNDDVVGGALINVSQDAVQEFQVATNRFSAEYGRSGSSVINIVTKSGTNNLRGAVSFFERDKNLQGLPATYDRRQPALPFDRQQYSGVIGGPFVKDKVFGFGSIEVRDQDGALLVGQRNVAQRTITRTFAPAPLRDVLAGGRIDVIPNDKSRLGFRYSFEDIKATDGSKLDRALGSASYRQQLKNQFHSFMANHSYVISSRLVNDFTFSLNRFKNNTNPVTNAIQLTFPSLLDGASFRVPQATKQNRLQFSDSLTVIAGNHTLKFGGDAQRVHSSLNLGVFRQGRIEFVQDFANFDRNGDGQINDGDLLFAVTLRSQFPDRPLVLPGVNNNHFAIFVQDDFRATKNLTLNLGLRYELDTNVKNNSGVAQTNPLVSSFYSGKRNRDLNNFAPRVGFNLALLDDKLSFHGGYGIYFDRVVLELITLERGLDGRALPVAVRAGNALTGPGGIPIYIDPATGRFVPGAPTTANPFTGFILPGAGASGINIIDNDLQNPSVQQTNFGAQYELMRNLVLRADYLHNFGTHFIIGRNIGVVNNPVVGGPDRVVNLESSVKFFYDGLLLSLERRFTQRFGFRAAYTLSKAFNYANDDQIPFSAGPIDSNNLQREFGPTPNDQRHRFTFAGTVELPYAIRLSPIVTLASAVPMDILLPDASTRVPLLQRNAGGRLFKNAGELNAFITQVNSRGGVNGSLLPLAPANARFGDNFSSFDLRGSKIFTFKERFRFEPIVEVFNLFNTTNILGVSNTNYSGFGNVLGSSSFGQPLTTAGGVFGSGGPRAFQLAGRFSF